MKKLYTVNNTRFLIRTLLLIMVFGLVITNPTALDGVLTRSFYGIQIWHLIWVYLMLELLKVLVPRFNKYIPSGKHLKKHADILEEFNKVALKEYTSKFNRRALLAGALWLILLSIIGTLYSKEILITRDIHLIVLFFYFADQFCINVWCPFRAWIIKNKCCNTCRIYNWGHILIFSPYIFIFSFWTTSLFIVSLLIFLQWEYLQYRYPERFSSVSNENLKCGNCLQGMCRYAYQNAITEIKEVPQR